MQAKDYYKTLGVPEAASADVIKKAYRKIAKENHPDRNPGDTKAEDRFKEASEAYGVLGDAEKRKKYDALRKYGFADQGMGGQGFPGGGQGFPGGVRFKTGPGGSQHIHFDGNVGNIDFADLFGDQSPFGDLFESLFGGAAGGARRNPRSGPRPGRNGFHPRPKPQTQEIDDFFRREGLDVHCTVWLKLDQLEAGAKVKVKTPSGKKALLKIPAGTEIGSVFRMGGLGLKGQGKVGDQFVHVEAVA
ncbi:MAG: DnaJ domain-containing protein [Candidatus Eisenbacteria bacterium]|uniref:DnaJ domain-containing protein n=1 Tax=Eiseniibacteriota bacterium TaxID=2212470 RepID=A0A7Y2E4W8_UNCEI|nr:DnaJ domain-containing protein [Candidatus Eisenbacteria bacterium]